MSKNKYLLIFSLFLTFIFGIAQSIYAKPLTLNEIMDSVCRVKAGNGYGTGTCIAENETSYFILTNGHVVGTNKNIQIEFFKRGYKSNKFPAKVIWSKLVKGSDIDFAIATIDKQLLKDHPPRIIPLAPYGTQLQNGLYIAAAGCPDARWAEGWEGHITLNDTKRILFTPAPVGGQSGTGLMILVQDEKKEWHTRVGAVLTWRINNGINSVTGGAIPVNTLYSVLMNESHKPVKVPVSYRPIVATTSSVTKKFTSLTTPNKCVWCGRSKEDHVLGSDGKLYCYSINSSGNKQCSLPPGVTIVRWGCCPPNNNSGIRDWFGGRNGNPILPQPQPTPIPSPTQPYNTTPPEIPGLIGIPVTPIAPAQNEENDYHKLKAENAALKKQLEVYRKAEVDDSQDESKKETSFVSKIFSSITGLASGGGFLGGMLSGLGLSLFYMLWTKVLRKQTVEQIDNLQDLLENKVREKWGDELAKESREILEQLESAVLMFVDEFLANMQAQKAVLKAESKDTLADTIKGKVDPTKTATPAEIMAAVKAASEKVGDDNVTTEVPKQVEKILKDIKK